MEFTEQKESGPWATHWFITSYEKPPKWDPVKMRYLVWQREVCPKSKKTHWHGHMELQRNARRTGAQKIAGMGKEAHFEKVIDRAASRNYCMKLASRCEKKDAGPFEYGSFETNPGKRTDLERAVKCKDISEVKMFCPTAYAKYFKGLNKLFPPKPVFGHKPKVIVLWGEGTGTGKSRSVKSLGEEKLFTFYSKSTDEKWWDGYDEEEVVLIDEFMKPGNHEWLTAGMFCTLCDYGPTFVCIKGEARVAFTSKYIFITSNVDPKTWFKEKWEVIKRRIDQIIYCGAVDNDCKDRLSDLKAIRSLELRQKALDGTLIDLLDLE